MPQDEKLDVLDIHTAVMAHKELKMDEEPQRGSRSLRRFCFVGAALQLTPTLPGGELSLD